MLGLNYATFTVIWHVNPDQCDWKNGVSLYTFTCAKYSSWEYEIICTCTPYTVFSSLVVQLFMSLLFTLPNNPCLLLTSHSDYFLPYLQFHIVTHVIKPKLRSVCLKQTVISFKLPVKLRKSYKICAGLHMQKVFV